MFVDPAYQRRGIGRRLLGLAIERCRAGGALEQLYLGVAKCAQGAQLLYHEAGFKVVGTEQRKIKLDNSYYEMASMLLELA